MSYMEAINVLLENVSSMKTLIFSLFFVFEMIKNDSMLIIFVKKSAYKIKECSSFHYSLILDEKILTDRTICILQKKNFFSLFFLSVFLKLKTNLSKHLNGQENLLRLKKLMIKHVSFSRALNPNMFSTNNSCTLFRFNSSSKSSDMIFQSFSDEGARK